LDVQGKPAHHSFINSAPEMSMSLQSAPWQSQLARGAVKTLWQAPIGRFLRVEHGQLWLTRVRADVDEYADHWLQAGDAIELPAGSAWLMEAREPSGYLLIEAEVALPARAPILRAWISAARAWFASPRPVLA
jgi:hypothetical protein